MKPQLPGPGAKVVLFSEVFHPDTTSTAYYMTEIARGLAVEFPVSAITATAGAAGNSSVQSGFIAARLVGRGSADCGCEE